MASWVERNTWGYANFSETIRSLNPMQMGILAALARIQSSTYSPAARERRKTVVGPK